MSAGHAAPRHDSWCPALSNRYRVLRERKGIPEYKPVGEVFDCLCREGRIPFTVPRPELVRDAVARRKARRPWWRRLLGRAA